MNLYEEYALLESKLAEIETKKESLRTKILEDMIKNNIDTPIKVGMGSFKKSMRKTWTYSPIVSELEEEFKARKVMEQNNDIATYIEKASLVYTPVKL